MNETIGNDIFEDIRREHDELRVKLRTVNRLLTGRVAAIHQVAESLNSLSDQLEVHFFDEENGGLFQTVCQQAPRFTRRSKRIRAEHAWLLEMFRNVVEIAQKGDGSDEWWKELERAFHQFSINLMHHESKESELLQDAYSEDIGAAD